MPFAPGSKLGAYEILSPLGTGGMGEVYRARDPRLRRDVAIKVMPAQRMADEDRRRRFVQEARAASALNHPNIVVIHEVDSEDGIDFIVMEYVAGETLQKLIPARGMALEQALRLAIPMADALARAHAAGIVHRDVKPANVMVSREGLVKVLDFGLAKLVAPPRPSVESDAETEDDRRGPLSSPGTVAGTIGYMSPEQATGSEVDSRSDVFSFGAVFYEMVTGRRAFGGDSAAEVVAAVLKEQPKPPGDLIADLPKEVDRLIRRCLRKEKERRFQHMLDVKLELEQILEELNVRPVKPAGRTRRRLVSAGVAGLAVAGLAGWLAAGASWWRLTRTPASAHAPALQLKALTAQPGVQNDPVLSPDGKLVAYAADPDGNVDLWVKQSSGGPPVRITDDPLPDWEPDWSPDGSRLVFRSERDGGGIYVVSALGGAAQRIATGGYYPRFSPDGSRVLFVTNPEFGTGSILVLELGGARTPRPLPTGPVQGTVGGARWHPDGKRVSFLAGVGERGRRTEATVWRTVSLADGGRRDTDLSPAVSAGVDPTAIEWAPSGDRVFIEGRSGPTSGLWRARIDPASFRLSDVETVTAAPGWPLGGFRLSGDGHSAVFVLSHARYHTRSLPFDPRTRQVKEEGESLFEDVMSRYCELSRDGSRLLCDSLDGPWIGDVRSRTRLPVFSDQAAALRNSGPLSPDGRHFAYQREETGDARDGVYVATIDGRDEHLVRPYSLGFSAPYGWSPDGRSIIGTSPRDASHAKSEIWAAPAWPAAGARTEVLASSATEDLWNSRLSPNGRWLAFSAVQDADGGQRVFVTPRSGGERRMVGAEFWDDVPCWSPDGRVLFILRRRHGFDNVWGVPFDPESGREAGEPFQLTRFERRSRVIAGSFSFFGCLRDRLLLGLVEPSSNVWRVDNIDR